MGNREDLLVAAKKCLQGKGYAGTTVRDLAAEAGVSMAAIGYHYGTKEALLNEALIELTREWGEAVGEALAAGGPETFAQRWDAVLASLPAHRALWSATFEVLGRLDEVPRVRELLADGLNQAKDGLGHLFGAGDTPEVGALSQALLTGLMAHLLIDPHSAPTGEQLAAAVRAIAGTLPG